MIDRARILAAAGLMASLAACAPTLGPPPPSHLPPSPTARTPAPADPAFSAADFAWSQAPGKNSIVGRLGPQPGPVHYTCAGASVILTPETPWSRRRMQVLYKSDVHAVLLADDVRARTSQAAPGNSDPYLKRAVCDASDKFSFAGLPDGAWYMITIARPTGTAGGASIAVMRRVMTRGGKATVVDL